MLATTLEDYRTAAADLEQAAGMTERMDAPVWSCQVRLETARMFAARGHPGDGERARAAAHEALEAARGDRLRDRRPRRRRVAEAQGRRPLTRPLRRRLTPHSEPPLRPQVLDGGYSSPAGIESG